MLYCCEVCGKKHTSEEKALECERLHEEEKARREELVKEKESRTDTINELFSTLEKQINDYKNDYGEYPIVVLSGKKNVNTLHSIMDSCEVRNIFPWYLICK